MDLDNHEKLKRQGANANVEGEKLMKPQLQRIAPQRPHACLNRASVRAARSALRPPGRGPRGRAVTLRRRSRLQICQDAGDVAFYSESCI
eukprot:6179493-Pleurochrysis_carterae.AAC.6